ncbi:hypothetical protein SESBI_44708 [Sesbania bispinosa]|nr:hypothetical protein SESBI_44708 [Sesbania bispinosa]
MAVVHHEVDAETFTAEVIKDIQENILGHGDKGEGSNLGEGVVQEGDKGGNSDAVGPSGCSLRKQVRIKSPTKRRPFSERKGKGKEAAGNGLTQNKGKGKNAPEGKGKKVAEGTSKVKVKRGRRHVTIEEDDSDEDIPEEVVGHRTTYATDNVFEGGDEAEQKFEVQCWHTKVAVDLGNQTCSCRNALHACSGCYIQLEP